MTVGARLSHPFYGITCPTCSEIPRLQRYCPDCRDRAYRHPGKYHLPNAARGSNPSGNYLLEKMKEERTRMEQEEAVAAQEEWIRRRTRNCPSCDNLSMIPDDDYICVDCRQAGP